MSFPLSLRLLHDWLTASTLVSYRAPTPFANPLLFLEILTAPFNASLRESLMKAQNFQNRGMGYFKVQATVPQTLAYSLADSPVGLLCWIYEKLAKAVDNYPWTEDESAPPALSSPRTSARR